MSDAPTIESSAVRVTFFEDRAAVERRASFGVSKGASRVTIGGVGPALDDGSLVAFTKTAGVRVVATRAVRRRRDLPRASAEEIEKLEADARTARESLGKAQQTLARAETELGKVGGIVRTWIGELGGVPLGAEGHVELERAYGSLDSKVVSLLDVISDAKGRVAVCAVTRAAEEARVVQARVAEARYEASLELTIESDSAREIDVEIRYRTPCALWRPAHAARLVDGEQNGTGPRVILETFAVAWQATGETWKDVACRFSTARPAHAASPPLIADDMITSQRRAEKKRIVVEARDQTIATAGVAGSRVPDEMPGVDDGGEPLWFEAMSTATIPSDGHPLYVALSERSLSCTTDLVCHPEISDAVRVRAKLTLTGKTPLLAGPVAVSRGTELVGLSRVSYVGAGEPFELGFGEDAGLRVRRAIKTTRKTTAVTGAQRVTREVTLYAQNIGRSARRVAVVERLPVSEVEAVRIDVDEGDFEPNEDGHAKLDVDLAAGAQKTIRFAWHIEAGSNVVLPALI